MHIIGELSHIGLGRKAKLALSIENVLLFCMTCFFSCSESSAVQSISTDPLFVNSIVATDIDFITRDDSSTFISLMYQGQRKEEMPDRRNDVLIDDKTFVFVARFSDATDLGIWVHSSFTSVAEAEKYAQMLTGPLGRLPSVMRKGLSHVVIHKGDETAFGESDGHFFVLYSENMETRIRNHDLEETVFHESVHATLEYIYKTNAMWIKAQENDRAFITEYAAALPNLEDLPETAIFAYTMLKHPGRLPSHVEEWINKNIPNRLAFFKTVFP